MLSPITALAGFAGIAAGLAVLLWPRTGVLARLNRRLRQTDRVLVEDLLKHLYHTARAGRPVRAQELSTALGVTEPRVSRALGSAVAGGLVESTAGEVRLSTAGREYALHVVRTHRLWERFLADRTGLAASEWHEEAERREHQLSPEETRRLADRMGRPAYDPHGDPIPEADGTLPPLEGVPVTAVRSGQTAEIVHIEDEPRASYLRLLEAGLAPGMRLTVTGRDASGTRFVAGGHAHHVLAADGPSLEVRTLEGVAAEGEYGSLADLRPGEAARVLGISAACQGPQRRRLLDLGVVPGTEIAADLAGAFGDPVAYRIRGALIALRREQASWVLVEPVEVAA